MGLFWSVLLLKDPLSHKDAPVLGCLVGVALEASMLGQFFASLRGLYVGQERH